MDEYELTGMERYEMAEQLLMELLGCGSGDVAAIMDMMQTHDDLLEATREYIDETGVSWSFGAFVSGIERLVLNKISERISEDLYQGLCEVQIDDNYVAWGAVASMGDLPLEVAEAFATMCRDGVDEERIDELMKWDAELYGGKQDEPDDDVDMDQLLDGIVMMMEANGVRGDVRAKAKEFLAAVAVKTLNEVIHEDE